MPYFIMNDLKLHYLENGQGDLVVFLPGNTASASHYQQDLDRLSDFYRTAALDFPGTGKSTRLQDWTDEWWQLCASCTAELIDHLCYQQAYLIGSSGGAITALLTAIQFPTKVKAVVADSAPAKWNPDILKEILPSRNDPSADQIAFYQYGHGEDWQEVVKQDTEMLWHFAERGGDWFEDTLEKITCPVLFTGSMEDEFIPDIGKQLADMAHQVKDSRVFLTHQGGHPLMWTCPDDFYRQIFNFFDTVC